ncbi:MAG: hypothetical protein KZQ67_16140 [gamma proteobacterium symbiont of Bathyaustriella thionipta]|nr:hypothetical protein [gamma proteobacterium symbiont of Bathyaustriella thionipta]MCU7951531.1 hypothetical protein [gamma proteobacterium symbiont of Bathyaustriella thionipta]MCU7958113.1 hypothetical protein [gamma proteobacterium symbiont of Bathyaustriella thionipta]
MHASYYLFSLYTWGNTSTTGKLYLEDISIKNNGMETDYIFKGRACKFIRLNIGKSSIDAKITGYGWFKRYLSTRKKLIQYLIEHENSNIDDSPLFFRGSGNGRTSRVWRFVPVDEKGIYQEKGWHIYNMLDVPSINCSRLRVTAEQYTDQQLKNPLIITEKAQHDISTYRNNYAKGNKIDSKKEMASALKLLVEGGVSVKDFQERHDAAESFGINLEKPGPDVEVLLNGLGCKRNALQETKEEKKFLQRQRKFGRNPKVCADMLACLDCEKCAVIEDENAIYHLLSFREMITYAKPTYIPSASAKEHYGELINKIDNRLAFVSEDIVGKAQARLEAKGPAEVWNS